MFSGAAYHWRSNTGANVYCAGVGVGQCLIGQGFALASSALRKMLGIERVPERVVSANRRELFRNGATAKKSFPKSFFSVFPRDWILVQHKGCYQARTVWQ
jgi:hypothetical protein